MEKTITRKKSNLSVKYLTRISFLALIGLIFELFHFALPIFPGFLKLDLSNLPSVIAGILMGPSAAILTEFTKNLLKVIIRTSTVGIGEISNFIIGVSLSVPISIIYRRKPGDKMYILSSIVGVISMVIVASLSNYFFVIPAFAKISGGLEPILEMSRLASDKIVDLKSLIVLGVVPFNLAKGILTVGIGYIVNKYVLPYIKD